MTRAPLTVLGIETSCDETAAAVVRLPAEGPAQVLSSVVASQIAEHAPFGGVVPEIAARAHVEVIDAIVGRALAEAGLDLDGIDAIAATAGPGLVGGVMVGLSFGKALALARDLSSAKGMSLLFASHLLPDVEAVCGEVLVLGRGRLLAQGRIDELKQPHDRQFEVRVKGDPLAFAGLLARRGITAAPADDHLLVELPPGATRQLLWETAGQAGEQVRALRCRRSTLEEIFLRAVAEQN